MIIAVKKPETHVKFCTFDTETMIYHTEPFYYENYDIRIFTEKVKDVEMLINDLDKMAFKKVSKEDFLRLAKKAEVFSDYPGIPNQFDNMTGSMNL